MVNYFVDPKENYSQAALDNLFSALSDSARRAVLMQLGAGPRTVNELSMPQPLSPSAISKHLKVLEQAGLIVRERHGRFHELQLQPAALEQAANWLAPLQSGALQTPLAVASPGQAAQRRAREQAEALLAELAAPMAVIRLALGEPPSGEEALARFGARKLAGRMAQDPLMTAHLREMSARYQELLAHLRGPAATLEPVKESLYQLGRAPMLWRQHALLRDVLFLDEVATLASSRLA
jgi:DNA-binding transcriptional ArsR family regulator